MGPDFGNGATIPRNASNAEPQGVMIVKHPVCPGTGCTGSYAAKRSGRRSRRRAQSAFPGFWAAVDVLSLQWVPVFRVMEKKIWVFT